MEKEAETTISSMSTWPRSLQEALQLTACLEAENDTKKATDIELIWSQVQLIYRAEGNANLVIALPQFNKILRLPKWQQSQAIEKDIQSGVQSATTTVSSVDSKEGPLHLAEYVKYGHLLRDLYLGKDLIPEMEVLKIAENSQETQWINDQLRTFRPVNRLTQQFVGNLALLMEDATQFSTFDGKKNLSMDTEIAYGGFVTQHNRAKVGQSSLDTFAVEIKPKQGWLLSLADVNSLLEEIASGGEAWLHPKKWHCNRRLSTGNVIKGSDISTEATIKGSHQSSTVDEPDKDNVLRCCRYCSQQFIKLKQEKIHQLGSYCPINLFSGIPNVMEDAIDDLLRCPQNNLRIYKNAQLIYDETISRQQQSLCDIFPRDKLFRMKRLLVAVLLRDLSKCHVDHSEIRQKPTLETTSSTVDTKVTSTVDARAKPVPLSDFLSDEKLHHYKQKIEDAEDDYDDGPKDLHCQLPKDCVLSRILRLQILAKKNLQYMLRHDYAKRTTKSYESLRSLLRKYEAMNAARCKSESESELEHEGIQFPISLQLSADEEYLLAATVLDCSIMITFQEFYPHQQDHAALSIKGNHFIIYLPDYETNYLVKVNILDLDPKSDAHFAKFTQQVQQIYEILKSESDAI